MKKFLTIIVLVLSFNSFAEGRYLFDCRMFGEYQEYKYASGIDHVYTVNTLAKQMVFTPKKIELQSVYGTNLEEAKIEFEHVIIDGLELPEKISNYRFGMRILNVPKNEYADYSVSKNRSLVSSDMFIVGINYRTSPYSMSGWSAGELRLPVGDYLHTKFSIELGQVENKPWLYRRFNLNLECYKPNL